MLDPWRRHYGPLEAAGHLPRAAEALALPLRRELPPVVAHRQPRRGLHRNVQEPVDWQVGGPEVRLGGRRGQELAEIAEDVELGVSQASDEDLSLLPGPAT